MTKQKVYAFVVAAVVALCIAPLEAFMVTCVVDRCNIGTEYIPRQPGLPDSLIIGAGTVTEFPAAATYSYIEVQPGGTLRVSRTHDTAIAFTHLVIIPGGMLDVGTQADPIPCTIKVDFMVRNVPIDFTKDPFQWGNGIINFGHQTRVGCKKDEKGESVGSLAAGDTTVTLKAAPGGWQVGDELLFPDAAQHRVQGTPRRETKVTIAALNGAVVTLSKGLDFEHSIMTDTDGALALMNPLIVNITRNIVIRSENAATPLVGTRGHTAEIGHEASWDIRYNAFVQMGRTTNVPFNDTKADPTVPGGFKIGTNQRAKYAAHFHHPESQPNSAFVGNVMLGDPTTTKWGLSVHGAHDVLVDRNVCVDFPGACIVTEDGYEVRNKITNNFAAYVTGNGLEGQGNAATLCPGCEGAAFWFRGIKNTITGNIAMNSAKGMSLFNQQQNTGSYPSTPGGPLDTPFGIHDAPTMIPIEMSDNIVAANTLGFEGWGTPRFPNKNLTAIYNSDTEVMSFISDGIFAYLVNPRIIGKAGNPLNATATYCVHSNQAYVTSLEIEGGRVAGCGIGIQGGGGHVLFTLANVILQNDINIAGLPGEGTFRQTDVMHQPVSGKPHQYIQMGNTAVWDGTDPLPAPGTSYYFSSFMNVPPYTVKNWQGTGEDYLLFYNQQLGNNISWYSTPEDQHARNTPEKGLTMQQSWDKYGLAWGRNVLKPSESVTLDGLDNLARKGLTVNWPIPRLVCTLPTLRNPVVPSADFGVRVLCVNTGDPNAASGVGAYSVDDDPVAFLPPDAFTSGPARTILTGAGKHVAPGTHTVKTWRTDKTVTTTILPASLMTFAYCVGTCDDVPPPTTVAVPNVVGKTKTQAIADLGAAGLALGVVTPQNSATAPVDQVLSENPNAGTIAPVASLVALVVSSGPAMVAVPPVVGLTHAAATAALLAAGLVEGASVTVTNPAPIGQVVSANPAVGTSVVVGSTVILTISSGPIITPPPNAPAGTYSYVCDDAGNCKFTFVKKP